VTASNATGVGKKEKNAEFDQQIVISSSVSSDLKALYKSVIIIIITITITISRKR